MAVLVRALVTLIVVTLYPTRSMPLSSLSGLVTLSQLVDLDNTGVQFYTPISASGAVAAPTNVWGHATSVADDRVYAIEGDNYTVNVYDGSGALIANIAPEAAPDAAVYEAADAVLVPQAGVVWVITDQGALSLGATIREYDTAGTYVRTITLGGLGQSVGVERQVWSAVKIGSVLYCLGMDGAIGPAYSDANIGRSFTGAIWRFDLAGLTDLPDLQGRATAFYVQLARDGLGHLYASKRISRPYPGEHGYSIDGAPDSEDGVEKYAADVLVDTYVFEDFDEVAGLAVAEDGQSLWVADHRGASGDLTFKLTQYAFDGAVQQRFDLDFAHPVTTLSAGRAPSSTPCEEAAEYDPDTPGDPVLALLPSPNATVTYDDHFTPVASVDPEGGSTACTIAPSVDGNLWIAKDNNDDGGSILQEVDPTTGDLIRTVTLPDVLIGEIHGRHALWDLGCCKLLSVDRDTHELIEITTGIVDPEDITVQAGAVTKRYGLIADPMDGALNSSGTRLIYVDGNALKLWSLKIDQDTNLPEDAYVRAIKTFDAPIIWPLWVADNSIFVFTGDFLGNGDILRIDIDGTLLQTYTYDASLFTGGLYGIAVTFTGGECDKVGTGKLILAGVSGDIPAFLAIDLLTGESDDLVPLDAIADDVGSFTPSMAGLCTLGEWARGGRSSTDGDPTDQGVTTYPTANVQCAPVTRSTVAPNPGCNSGGRGWVPSYVGPSGVVPTVADPIPGETLTGKRSIYVEAAITHTRYETGGSPETIIETEETLRSAVIELDDDERKEGRIQSIGDIEHGSSDANGNLQAATIDLHLMDADGRPYGSRMDDPALRYFARDEIVVRARSDVGRRANGPYRMIGRALLQGESYSQIVAQLSGVDPLFADGGSFGPDKTVPQWTYPVSFYANAPQDVSRLFMPIIGGEKSDEGAIDPETLQVNARGLCPLRFVGMDGLGTGDGSPAETELWGRFNICLFASYQVVALYGADLGGLGLFGRNARSNGAKDESTIALDGTLDLSLVPTNGYANLILYTPTGRSELRIIGKGTQTVLVDSYVDPALVDGSSWYITRIDRLARRVKIDLDVRNGAAGDCMVPKWPNYIRPTVYEDFIGPDGSYRVTDVWVRGPLLQAHLAGDVTLAANMIGIEDQGDGSGLPITDYFTFANWWADNCLHVQAQQPTGPGTLWPQTNGEIPLWSDGVAKTRQSTFAAAQAFTAAALGGNGLQISAYFGEGMSLRDATQQIAENGGCRWVIDEYGSLGVSILDLEQDPSTWPRIDHVSRVFGEVRRWRAHDETQNVVQGSCDWDPDGQKYREEQLSIVRAAAIRHSKGIQKRSKHIDGKLLANPDHFQWLLERHAVLYENGPVYVAIDDCDAGLLDYPVWSGIQFTSQLCPGAFGWVDRPLIILSKNFHTDQKTVSLLCLDVAEILVPVGSPA